MKNGAIVLAVLFLSCCLCMAGDHDNSFGFGATEGTIDATGFDDYIEFTGFTVFGKIGFTSNWGLLLSWRSMEDDEALPLGGKIEYDQLGAHAVYMWRDGKIVRPHVKFGIVNTDVEASIVGLSGSEDETSVSVGAGLEAGTRAIAFYTEIDYTEIEIDSTDIEIANVTLGIVFKF